VTRQKIPTSFIEHLVQAGLHYIEQRNVNALQGLLHDCPEIPQAEVESGRLVRAAVLSKCTEALRVMLAAGADPNISDGEFVGEGDTREFEPGSVPLHYACEQGNEEMVRLLLEHGADPSMADNRGCASLHLVSSPKIAELLLEAGADPNADCTLRNFNDTFSWYFVGTPLHVAARRGATDMLRILHKYGADINRRDFVTGHTALLFATETGNQEGVKTLLKLGANPDPSIDQFYKVYWHTPHHRATQLGNRKILIDLLKAGADPNVKGGSDGKTAAEFAIEKDYTEIAKIIEKHASNKRIVSRQRRQNKT
jgi:ankyrin repeat protein